MLTTLHTAYTDTRAGDLAWCLGKEALPALAVLDLELGSRRTMPLRVQLRLLGASHQVLLDSPRGGCSETVACIPGSPMPLPFGVARRIGVWDYEFAARVETMSQGCFAGRAQELLALVADHPNGLAGTFPGDPHAFTAMLAQYEHGYGYGRGRERGYGYGYEHDYRDGDGDGAGRGGEGAGVRWRTWHAYPQEGRLVATRSRLSVLRGLGSGPRPLPGSLRPQGAEPTGSHRAQS